jgi:hypothetical protein
MRKGMLECCQRVGILAINSKQPDLNSWRPESYADELSSKLQKKNPKEVNTLFWSLFLT